MRNHEEMKGRTLSVDEMRSRLLDLNTRIDNFLNLEEYMLLAYGLALEAEADGEAPVGCIIIDVEGRIIGRGRNRREGLKSATAHAEIEAIEEACKTIGDWRLSRCTMYVTLEPCPMCAGAIVQARIPTVVYGAKSPKSGCAGSILDILNEPRFNHQVAVIDGVCEEECAALMSEFFLRFRDSKTPSS